MDAGQRPRPQASAMGVVIIAVAVALSVTHGIGAVFIVTLAGWLAAGHLAHRYVATHLGEHYARHGDRMD
jgi:uncharacterized membrane protein YczE